MKSILQKLANLWGLIGKQEAKFLYDDVVSSLIKYDSERAKKSPSRDFSSLADKLISIYHENGCKGKKTGSVYWTSSSAVVEQRLQSLDKKSSLAKYTDEDIANATEKYINVQDKTFKRSLFYFIWKEDGGFKSDLLDELTRNKNGEEEQHEQDDDWLYQ